MQITLSSVVMGCRSGCPSREGHTEFQLIVAMTLLCYVTTLCCFVLLFVFSTLEGRICVARLCTSVPYFFVNKLLLILYICVLNDHWGR